MSAYDPDKWMAVGAFITSVLVIVAVVVFVLVNSGVFK